MKHLLAQYNNFEDCVLLDVRWKHWGYAIELVFNYIWNENAVLRENLDIVEERVVVKFSGVQEFLIRDQWNDSLLTEPEEMDWGSGQISIIRLENGASLLEKYGSRSVPFNHAVVLWESERRIDVVFSQLDIFRE